MTLNKLRKYAPAVIVISIVIFMYLLYEGFVKRQWSDIGESEPRKIQSRRRFAHAPKDQFVKRVVDVGSSFDDDVHHENVKKETPSLKNSANSDTASSWGYLQSDSEQSGVDSMLLKLQEAKMHTYSTSTPSSTTEATVENEGKGFLHKLQVGGFTHPARVTKKQQSHQNTQTSVINSYHGHPVVNDGNVRNCLTGDIVVASIKRSHDEVVPFGSSKQV